MMKKQNCVIWTQTVFIVYIKTGNMYKDVAEDVKTRFDNSNYVLNKLDLKKRTRKLLI